MSEERMTIDELAARQGDLQNFVGRKMQHIKSGNWYRITDVRWREEDMTLGFDYQTMHQRPAKFWRPVVEILDTKRFAIHAA